MKNLQNFKKEKIDLKKVNGGAYGVPRRDSGVGIPDAPGGPRDWHMGGRW